MTQSISLLLGVHAHQPVGNFPHVVDEAHERCYRPFLQTLHRFPEFRYAIHFSGWLLDYLLQKYPEDMALLHEMVQRGQAELFGAGDTEPVLAVIPARDRLGQIQKLSNKLEQKLGERPAGAWLTERVWEATVVPALADSGIRYVTVDDYHFLCAGKLQADLDGFFSTEEDGRRLDLFPISEALRYRLPFSPAPEAVQYLEGLAREGGEAAAIYFDDIEKFGIWPETYEWVYEKGWLVDFIQGVLASPTIRTSSYRDYHARCRTRGVVYLPTTSYIEMNEWTLPAAAAGHFAELVTASKEQGRFEQDKAFLRGGIWKNFLTRYPEANWMHKRMLSLSQRLAELPAGKETPEMREKLYEAQANDAYWHGLFGGIYLPHLRRAVYQAMVRLESLLDHAQPRPKKVRTDLDLDGREEIFLHNGTLQAVALLDGSGSLCELDAYELGHNFGDTLRRQSEHYYRKMHLSSDAEAHAGAGIASPHDRVSFKHEIGPQDLVTDASGKTMFRDAWLPAEDALGEAVHYVAEVDTGHAHGVAFAGEVNGVEVGKHITLADNRLSVAYRVGAETAGMFMTELNLAMPSCDGPAGRFVYRNGIPGGFGQLLELEELTEITLEDDVLGGVLVLRTSRPVRFRAFPCFTVSQSEAGFEKIMQAVTIMLWWPLQKRFKEVIVELEAVSRPH
jgi:alpha-amylase/alpha-mannosidase (GH57 family)